MPGAPVPGAVEAMASLSAVAQVALATYAATRPAQGGVPLAAEAGIDAPVAMVAGAAGQAASIEALAKKFGDFQPAPLARRGGDEAARLVLAQPLMSAPADAWAVTTATMLEGQEGQEQGGSMPILAPLVPQSERASRPGAPPGASTRLTAADAALTEMQALIDRIATWTQALRVQQGADGSWLARIAFPGEGSLAVRVSQTPDLVAVQLAGSEALATRVRGALESGGTRNGKALTVSVAALAAAEEGEDHG